MNKNILLNIAFLLGFAGLTQAQSNFNMPFNYPNAYTDYVYDAKDVKVVTETYEKNVPKVSFPVNVNNPKVNVVLDIYYGENPSVNLGLRPLIIFAPGGGRDKSDYKYMAADLARRGFVTASINVRTSIVNPIQLLVNAKNINPVLIMTGAMDLHNAINYLINQRAKALNIDPNWVITAGGSLGSAVSLQGAFMDKNEAIEKYGKNVNNAFFDDYDSKLQTNNIKGVLDFYGAVYDVNFIKPNETKPVFMFHGSADPAVPYMEGNLFYKPTDVYVYGSVRIAEKIKDQNSFYLVTGKDVGHSLTPQCGYKAASFPNGYPMNWYPDMLFFIKNAILQNQSIKVYKTVDCVEPECSMSKSSCRVVTDDASNGSKKPSNAVIPKPNFNRSILSTKIITPNNTNVEPPKPVIVKQTTGEKLNHCKVLSFDGNDFVKVNRSAALSLGFDVEFWYKQTVPNTDNTMRILFSIGSGNDIKTSAFTFGLLGNNKIYVGYFNGNTYIEKTQEIKDAMNNSYTVDGNWHHYHFKIEGQDLKGDIDDNKGTFSLMNSIITKVNTNNNSITYFGGADFGGNITYPFSGAVGQMQEIRLWRNRYSYSNNDEAVSPDATGLLTYWKLNASTQIVKDESVNSIDGTLGSNSNVEASDPTFVNNCDGSTVAVPIVTTPEKAVTVATPAPSIATEGINIINTAGRPVAEFYSQKAGKGVLTVINSNNKNILCKNVQISVGTTNLNAYIQQVKTGNYTLKMVFNKKTYRQQFSIPK